MIIYQFQCQDCNKITDEYFNISDCPTSIQCQCKGIATKIISIPGPSLFSESPEWIKSLVDVVEKDSDKKHCNEFLKNPTRDNYKTWLQKEGLRHMEPGENLSRPAQKEITADQLMKYRRDKRSLRI